MKKLAFGLILGGTIYAPVEITRCIIRDMTNASHAIVIDSWAEVIAIWFGYIVAMIVLTAELRIFSRAGARSFSSFFSFRKQG